MSSGVLTSIGTYATGLQPVAMGIDPSTNHFLYTANFLANTVSGFELSTTDGTLLDSQFSPYTTNARTGRRSRHSTQRHRSRSAAMTACDRSAPAMEPGGSTPYQAFTIMTGQPKRVFLGLEQMAHDEGSA